MVRAAGLYRGFNDTVSGVVTVVGPVTNIAGPPTFDTGADRVSVLRRCNGRAVCNLITTRIEVGAAARSAVLPGSALAVLVLTKCAVAGPTAATRCASRLIYTGVLALAIGTIAQTGVRHFRAGESVIGEAGRYVKIGNTIFEGGGGLVWPDDSESGLKVEADFISTVGWQHRT